MAPFKPLHHAGLTPIVCVGETREELSGSEWAHVVHGHLGGLPPAVRQLTLPGCGHVPTWDDPELVIGDLADLVHEAFVVVEVDPL